VAEPRIIVTLSSYEDEMAVLVGTRRHYANVGKGDRLSYQKDRLEADNCAASIDACRAEVAVAKAYGAFWNGSIWHATEHYLHAGLPDLYRGETEMEVKRRRSSDYVPIDLKDAELDRLVIWAQVARPNADQPYPRVHIIGEIGALEAWEAGEPYNSDNRDSKRRRFHRSGLRQPRVRQEFIPDGYVIR